jgi:hypothetical protein
MLVWALVVAVQQPADLGEAADRSRVGGCRHEIGSHTFIRHSPVFSGDKQKPKKLQATSVPMSSATTAHAYRNLTQHRRITTTQEARAAIRRAIALLTSLEPTISSF